MEVNEERQAMPTFQCKQGRAPCLQQPDSTTRYNIPGRIPAPLKLLSLRG